MIFTFFASLLMAAGVFAQTPQSFNYQAIARDGSGNLLANKPIGLQLSILDGSATGAVVYAETFSLTTNDLGLFTLGVGTGTVVSGSFSVISWSTGSKYLRTELDPTGGSHYTLNGTAQLLSVPYALYANAAGSSAGGPWTVSGNDITNGNSGSVGIAIGNAPLQNLVQIGNPPSFIGNTFAMGNGSQGMSFGFAGASLTSTWFSNNNFSLMPAFGSTGYLGIGTESPTNQLQIGSTPGFASNNLAMGNGTQAMSFFQDVTTSTWFSNTSFSLMPAGGTGNVGIGIHPSTTVKLEIQPASSGTAIFITGSGNRTAFEAQSGDFLLDGGDASISGNLNIGGGDPNSSPLVVNTGLYVATAPGDPGVLLPPHGGFSGSANNMAIDASAGNVWGQGFYATSDARVKNILGPSDAAADLEKLNRIRVTDYTMKDTIATGNRKFKKVIAQQVEEVYPDVIRKQRGFIPNIYLETAKMERTDSGYILSFDSPHHLSAMAKRLRMSVGGLMKPYQIISIPSIRQVEIKSPALRSQKAFVYGEEVDDFRTVDYEGLSALNISATQELSKLVSRQAQLIESLRNRISRLESSSLSHTPVGK